MRNCVGREREREKERKGTQFVTACVQVNANGKKEKERNSTVFGSVFRDFVKVAYTSAFRMRHKARARNAPLLGLRCRSSDRCMLERVCEFPRCISILSSDVTTSKY